MSTHKVYWPLVLEDLKSRVSAGQWEAWFLDMELVKIEIGGQKIRLGVPSRFHKEQVEKKYFSDLLCSVNKYFPNIKEIIIEINLNQTIDNKKPNFNIQRLENLKTDPIFEGEKKPLFFQNQLETGQQLNSSAGNLPSRYSKNENPDALEIIPKGNIHNLNPKFTFQNYVSTSFNELAVSVAGSIIKQPGTLYNPVFIHSGTGLGKSHLLQAIGHKMLETYPNFQVRFVTAETFLNHYITSMRAGKSGDFRNYYRDVDLLMIDDIQFLAGKTGTQEAFFHTFNELLQSNKQIIITSDKPPKSLGGIEDRLVSRFEMGMVVDLSTPTVEDKYAIIKDKCNRRRLAVTDSQMLQIAQSVQTNFRDIEGVLNKIEVYLQLNKGAFVSTDYLDKILNPYLQMLSAGLMHFDVKKSEFDEIFSKVSRQWMVDASDIPSKRRDKLTVIARQAIMYVMHRHCGVSMASIGKVMGGRDHTTIVHGCQKIELLMKTDIDIQIKIRSALEDLNLEAGLF